MNEPTEAGSQHRVLRLCECGCGQRTALATRNDARRGLVKGEPRGDERDA